MPRIAYTEKNFGPTRLEMIEKANEICAEFRALGYDLTLRQLYYQFVSRDLLPNQQKEYKRLGETVNEARLAGLVDWNDIVDRTRNLQALAHWDNPADIVASAAAGFRTDRWANQEHRVEVWVEKDALIGVIGRTSTRYDVPYFSCRGYTSQSELWGAAQRLIGHEQSGQRTVVIHLGDHDPSGVDMSRDIRDRLKLFRADVKVIRIALNMDQVEAYSPPPNPAKITDSRASGYIEKHGFSSWELDALDPTVLGALIESHVKAHRDEDQWARDTAAMEAERTVLQQISDRWDDVRLAVETDTL